LNSVICRDISAAISGPDILVTSNDLREAFEECDFMSRPQWVVDERHMDIGEIRALPLGARHPTWEP